jgi:hypothetical protein
VQVEAYAYKQASSAGALAGMLEPEMQCLVPPHSTKRTSAEISALAQYAASKAVVWSQDYRSDRDKK